MSTYINTKGDSECKLIFSCNNIHIRRIRKLQDREARARTGLYIVEGVRNLVQAAQNGCRFETLLLAPKLLQNLSAQRLVKKERLSGTPCYGLSPEVYYSLSQAEEPQGVLAVLRQRWDTLERIQSNPASCWLAVESIQSPGNLGTIVRTCEAVGAAGIILVGENADPYDPVAVRASMGALFRLRFIRVSFEEFTSWKLMNPQFRLVGTSPSAVCDYQSADFIGPVILAMGSEKKGLSEEMLKLCDEKVSIPMIGRSDSLNVAVATGIMLYEIFNQQRHA